MTIKPMLASPNGGLDIASFDMDKWAIEVKWDGMRAMCVEGKLYSRAGHDITADFPSLVLPTAMVLDGEIVAYPPNTNPHQGSGWSKDVPQFNLLQNRKNTEIVICYRVFDVLSVDGVSVMHKKYSERRLTLKNYFNDLDEEKAAFYENGGLLISPSIYGSNRQHDFKWYFDSFVTKGHEGVILKRRDSIYMPGSRSRDWLKFKKAARLSAIVVGAEKGSGRRAGGVGALQIALLDGSNIVQIGSVGTGFTDADLNMVQDLLYTGEPFVIDVEYMEVTVDRKLRFPSFKGVRGDISALDCKVEQLSE